MGNSYSNQSETECPVCKQETKQRACMNPYIWFYLDVYKELAPKSIKEIGTEAGRRWRTMTKEEKEPYVKIAKKNRDIIFPQSKSQNKNLGKNSVEFYRTVGLRKTKQGRRTKKKSCNNGI